MSGLSMYLTQASPEQGSHPLDAEWSIMLQCYQQIFKQTQVNKMQISCSFSRKVN